MTDRGQSGLSTCPFALPCPKCPLRMWLLMCFFAHTVDLSLLHLKWGGTSSKKEISCLKNGTPPVPAKDFRCWTAPVPQNACAQCCVYVSVIACCYSLPMHNPKVCSAVYMCLPGRLSLTCPPEVYKHCLTLFFLRGHDNLWMSTRWLLLDGNHLRDPAFSGGK